MPDISRNHPEIRRLLKYAFMLGVKTDEAWDLAADAYVSGLQAGCAEWHYTSACLRMGFLTRVRNRKRRNLDYEWTFQDGEDEPNELKQLAIAPPQETYTLLCDTLSGIAKMPEQYRKFIILAAQEYTTEEIAEAMNVPVKEVYWRVRLARKWLREKGYMDEAGKRGHARFIGIRKDCRKWVAAIRKGNDYWHLGYFSTASEAAKAYDLAAIEVHGAAAKLNFPMSEAI